MSSHPQPSASTFSIGNSDSASQREAGEAAFVLYVALFYVRMHVRSKALALSSALRNAGVTG